MDAIILMLNLLHAYIICMLFSIHLLIISQYMPNTERHYAKAGNVFITYHLSPITYHLS